MAEVAEEPRYSAAEWKAREAKRECTIYGHSWQFTYAPYNNIPVSMHCERPCGIGACEIIYHPPEEKDGEVQS